VRNRLIAGLVMLAAVSGSVSAQAASSSDMKWSVSGGVSQPVGDFSNSAKTGFGAGLSAEWKLNADWGLRGDLSYYTFGGKKIATFTLPSQSLIGLAGNFVHHDDTKLYYSAGANFSSYSCSGCTSSTKPGVQAGLGYIIDDAKMWSIEGGIGVVFMSGSNLMHIPIGVRYSF